MSKIPGTDVDKSDWLRRETELQPSDDEDRCRFNCRTKKENWMQGYIEAQHNAARGVKLDAIEAWNEQDK